MTKRKNKPQWNDNTRIAIFKTKSGRSRVSYSKATFDKSIKKTFSGKQEWVVSFNNVKGIKGTKLFIFLRPSGKFIAANFSGQ